IESNRVPEMGIVDVAATFDRYQACRHRSRRFPWSMDMTGSAVHYHERHHDDQKGRQHDGSDRRSELETPYELPPDAVSRYARDGFVRLPDVLSPETIAAYEPTITAKVIELNTMHLPLEERDTYH